MFEIEIFPYVDFLGVLSISHVHLFSGVKPLDKLSLSVNTTVMRDSGPHSAGNSAVRSHLSVYLCILIRTCRADMMPVLYQIP